MSISTLRERLRAANEDERITLAEVESLLRAAFADRSLNEMEELFLRAALEAHAPFFEDDAREALRKFLEEHPAPKLP